MATILYVLISLLVIPKIFGFTQNQDNMCYKCGWVDGGLNSINGQFYDAPLDRSCKWGAGKPNDKFLVNCKVDEEEGFQYFYRCMNVSVKGSLVNENDKKLNGTFYECGVRRVKIPTDDFGDSDNLKFKVSRICQHDDNLYRLIQDYRDETGKEFLQNMTNIFKPEQTMAHLCTCDFACYEPEGDDNDNGTTTEEDDGRDKTTSDPSVKTTEALGGNAGGSCADLKFSSFVLILMLVAYSFT